MNEPNNMLDTAKLPISHQIDNTLQTVGKFYWVLYFLVNVRIICCRLLRVIPDISIDQQRRLSVKKSFDVSHPIMVLGERCYDVCPKLMFTLWNGCSMFVCYVYCTARDGVLNPKLCSIQLEMVEML